MPVSRFWIRLYQPLLQVLIKRMPTESLSQPDKKVPDPLGFFQVVHGKFQEAERNAGGPLDVFCEMAGYKIRLRFAGPALVPFILPALGHLNVAPYSAPTLTICLWDSVSTRTKITPPPWSDTHYTPAGKIARST